VAGIDPTLHHEERAILADISDETIGEIAFFVVAVVVGVVWCATASQKQCCLLGKFGTASAKQWHTITSHQPESLH